MTGRENLGKGVVCLILLTFTFGCTTTLPVTMASPQDLVDSVAVGDNIEIERKDGTRAKLNVTEVSKEGIRGSGILIAYADIQQVLVSRENWVGTSLVVILGITALYALEKNSDCGIFTLDSECGDLD